MSGVASGSPLLDDTASIGKYRDKCMSTDMLCTHTSSLHQQLDLEREWLYEGPLRLLLTLVLHTEDICTVHLHKNKLLDGTLCCLPYM